MPASRHVFIVHSNLTHLVAGQILCTENLPPEQCLWLTDRHWPQAPEGVPAADLSDIELPVLRLAEWQRLPQTLAGMRHGVQEIDRRLAEALGENTPFVLYLPHQRYLTYCAVLSHPRCTGFYYLEEGMVNYQEWPDPPLTPRKLRQDRLLRFVNKTVTNGRLPGLLYYFDFRDPKLRGVYVLSERAFPRYTGPKRVLPLPFHRRGELAGIQAVIVLDPFVEYHIVPLDAQLRAVDDLLQYLLRERGRGAVVHYKFHPSQRADSPSRAPLEELLARYAGRLELQPLSMEVNLEEVAVSSDADFYVSTSSTSVYALAAGRTVITYAPFYVRHYPPFQRVVEEMPKAVREGMVPVVDWNPV